MLGLLDCFEQILIQPFMPDGAIVALNIGVLLWLARLDMVQRNAFACRPLRQCCADIFRPVVDPNGEDFRAIR